MSDEKNTVSSIFKVLAEKTKGTAVGSIFDTLRSEEGRKAIESLAGRVVDTVKTAATEIKNDAEEALLTARLATIRKNKAAAQAPAADSASVSAPNPPEQKP